MLWYLIGDQVYIEAKSTLTLCEVKVYGRKPFEKKARSCGTPKVSGAPVYLRVGPRDGCILVRLTDFPPAAIY